MNSLLPKILLICAFFFLSLCSENSGILQVQGSSLSSLKPDLATLTFQIKTLSVSARDSLEKNNQIISNATSALLNINISYEEMGTSNFNLGPSYENIYHRNNNTSENIFKGYQASNTLTVKTRKMEIVGIIIDTVVKSGVENIQSVDFNISPDLFKKVQDDMLREAVKDAKNKAELALKPINGKINGIKSISLNQERPNPRPVPMPFFNAFAADAVSSKTQVYAAKKDLNVRVDVQFYVSN